MSLIIDTCNLYYCTRKAHDEARIDYKKYIDVVFSLFGQQEPMIAYVTRPDDTAEKFISYLETIGFQVITKEPRPLRVGTAEALWTNFNVELSVATMANANKHEPMIIGSSDPHLTPLLKVLQSRVGILYVYASGIPKVFRKYATVQEIGRKVLRPQKYEQAT
jgi:hypothetical protein